MQEREMLESYLVFVTGAWRVFLVLTEKRNYFRVMDPEGGSGIYVSIIHLGEDHLQFIAVNGNHVVIHPKYDTKLSPYATSQSL